jgi:hypothetical protein
MDDRPTDTGHHERRRVASLSYVEMETSATTSRRENPRCPESEEILDEQELTRLG